MILWLLVLILSRRPLHWAGFLWFLLSPLAEPPSAFSFHLCPLLCSKEKKKTLSLAVLSPCELLQSSADFSHIGRGVGGSEGMTVLQPFANR